MKFLLKDNISIIKKVKVERKKIVFTNGCFDLLHVGHIRYLAQAKKLGDFLIIGLNSDSSVKALKGKDRPINSFEDRAVLLSALTSVDLVIIFEELTPENLIKEIVPDVLVKGGDYNIEDIVGFQTVIQNGGLVKSLSFYDGYSTTNYINNAITATFPTKSSPLKVQPYFGLMYLNPCAKCSAV